MPICGTHDGGDLEGSQDSRTQPSSHTCLWQPGRWYENFPPVPGHRRLDLALLGAQTEALLWISVRPGALQEAARPLSAHPHVRFCAAATGLANLVVALAAANLEALYTFLTDAVGSDHRHRHHPPAGDRQTHGPDTTLTKVTTATHTAWV
ncbi:Lrp/AsnC ligand binding domain-containing protein [Streptomyces collinus]|uniref:Lrp/AsnC ligand binding domain-containing protein n=1 Tax=Streptomyces collinus TaxID=42684 RepID=UPI003811B680